MCLRFNYVVHAVKGQTATCLVSVPLFPPPHGHTLPLTLTRTSPSCPCRESYGPTARFTRKAALYFTQSLARALQTPATSEKHGSEDTTARQLVNQPAEQRETREHERETE